MSENLRRIAILFSVVLNVAFLGTYLYREVPRWAGGSQPAPHGGPLPYQALHMTEAQQRKFEPIRQRFHARMKEVGGEIKQEQLRLVDLLAQPEQDLESVRATQERIRELQRVMQDAVIGHLVEEGAFFTAEQRAQFFGILRERIEQAQPAAPPWMRSVDKAQGTEGKP
ncbi:MAG: periplasmic heavy metal sensor [Deltaproteobacteria bacterium]|nr:periplasmic heavy metal sensor [Deltaproteobacteria bacterium]